MRNRVLQFSFCCYWCHYCSCRCCCCCTWCRFTNAQALVCITLVSYFLFFHTQLNHLLFCTFLFSRWDFLSFPLSNAPCTKMYTICKLCHFTSAYEKKEKYLELFAVALAKCVDDATAIIVHDDGGKWARKENRRKGGRQPLTPMKWLFHCVSRSL